MVIPTSLGTLLKIFIGASIMALGIMLLSGDHHIAGFLAYVFGFAIAVPGTLGPLLGLIATVTYLVITLLFAWWLNALSDPYGITFLEWLRWNWLKYLGAVALVLLIVLFDRTEP